MSKDPLEFEETTKFNVIKEFEYIPRHAFRIYDDLCMPKEADKELCRIYIQRKSHNNTKHRWLCINAKTNKFDPFFNDTDERQKRWDEHIARLQAQKDVEDYLRETGSLLGL